MERTMLGSRALSVPYRRGAPPGVYEQRRGVARSAEVRMDVAAFVGLTQRGPLDRAIAVGSFEDYLAWFGAPGGGRRLAQAVKLFFDNGGRRCVVARALDASKAKASVWRVPILRWGADPLLLEARDPGAWGDEIRGRFRLTLRPASLSAKRSDVAATPVAWPWAVVRDPSITKGSTLRRTWTAGGSLLEELGVVVDEELRGRDRLVRIAGMTADPGPAGIGLLTEVRLDIDLSVPEWRERHVDLGLHETHPRYALAVIQGDEQRGLGPGSRLVTPKAPSPTPPDELVPVGPLEQAEKTSHTLISDPTSLGGDLLEAGFDAADTTARMHFFTALSGRKTPLELLDDHDDSTETEPVSLVAMPDLVHIRPAGADSVKVEATPTLVFDVCTAPQPIGTPNAVEYPLLLADPATRADLRAWQSELVQRCEEAEVRRSSADGTGWGRVAILDLPPGLTGGEILEWRRAVQSSLGCSALYAPYLRVAPAEDPEAALATVAPCGAVCGAIARAEALRGVYEAPANEAIRGVVSLHEDGLLPDAGFLHEARVDLIRPTERGLFLLGSRTTSEDPEWTHLHVRRLLHWLERQLAVDTRWAVFEPNDRRLWARLAHAVERRLRGVLAAGGLAGRTPEDSYFVRCDARTNTRAAEEGKVIVEVGVAPSVPAEMIVFELTQLTAGAGVEGERG